MAHTNDFEPAAFHPLTGMPAQTLSRRRLLIGAGCAVAAYATGGASVEGQGALATPEVQVTGDDDAVEVLERAAKTLAELESFSFEMQTVRGSSTIFSGFELESVVGSVRRPTDLIAEVAVSIPLGDLVISAISLDGVFYIQDPLSDGAWMEIGQMGEIQTLVNPDVLILTAVRLIKDARITGSGKVDGVDATIIEGTVDFSGLLNQMGGQSEGAEQEQMGSLLADEPVQVAFWIDEGNRPVEVEMLGPIFASESDDVVRVVSLFDFNEPVEIEAPELVSTPSF